MLNMTADLYLGIIGACFVASTFFLGIIAKTLTKLAKKKFEFINNYTTNIDLEELYNEIQAEKNKIKSNGRMEVL